VHFSSKSFAEMGSWSIADRFFINIRWHNHTWQTKQNTNIKTKQT
jgi:hypothetical protein